MKETSCFSWLPHIPRTDRNSKIGNRKYLTRLTPQKAGLSFQEEARAAGRKPPPKNRKLPTAKIRRGI
jgi:hypothetical protein